MAAPEPTAVFSDEYTFFGESVLVSVEAAGEGMFAVRCGDPAATPAIRANRHFAVLHRQLSERVAAVRRDVAEIAGRGIGGRVRSIEIGLDRHISPAGFAPAPRAPGSQDGPPRRRRGAHLARVDHRVG